jgi:hypothetical protein
LPNPKTGLFHDKIIGQLSRFCFLPAKADQDCLARAHKSLKGNPF